ncbi:MAG: DUF502 domain-containing protein [Candidatus Hydrogenedentota bacterium]
MNEFKTNKDENFLRQYFRAIRFYLVTGLLVWIPLIVTVWLTWWLFKNVGLGIERVIENGYAWLNGVGERVDQLEVLTTFQYHQGFGFLTAVALFLTTGFLARNLVGQRFIRAGEQLVSRVPGINRIYRAVRQIRDVFVGREGAVFQRVCVIQYPRPGLYAVAFVTSEEQGLVQKATGKKLSAVFVPTTPNPTSGFLLYVPTEEIIDLDIKAEEAMKLIISAGAYIPGIHDDETSGEKSSEIES